MKLYKLMSSPPITRNVIRAAVSGHLLYVIILMKLAKVSQSSFLNYD